MTEELRDELIKPAIKFLRDPKVIDAPMAKKIAFLESKGLTQKEIEYSIKQSTETEATTLTPPPAPLVPPGFYPVQSPSPFGYFKDVLLGMILTGGTGYAVFQLAKYYWSSFFPSDEVWNNEKLKLDGALEDTRSITKQSTEYAQKLETSMTKMNELLIQLTASEEQRNTEIRLLKEDLEAVKNLVPSLIEKAQDLQKNTVSELQTEIKSLKGILLNRRGGNVNPTQSVDPSSILSVVPSGQATLPSWQLETVKSGCSDTLSATEE